MQVSEANKSFMMTFKPQKHIFYCNLCQYDGTNMLDIGFRGCLVRHIYKISIKNGFWSWNVTMRDLLASETCI